ncbi:hypothetical protein FOA52_005755 [Chlamydomonas sp. UWO 241]|nr:hypothetical protein FOA52_005755 [Chlamydomonas sp. UWO 241]
MRALVVESLGDPTAPLRSGVLALRDIPAPKLKPGSVRIGVAAASLNFPDALQVQGKYQVKLPLPFIPGSEVSGVVTEVGPGVKALAVGDRVAACTMGGAFAEQVVVAEAAVWKLPDGFDLHAAAAVPVVYGTADLALRVRAQLKKGQTLLVLGAAGGVGVAACQIGLATGATVVAVVRGPEKAAFMRQLGVTAVIDSAALGGVPLHKAVKAVAKKGADVIFDPVGGAMLDEALKAAAPWGAQYLVIGFAAGDIPKVPTNILLVKNMTMHGVFWGSYLQHRPDVLTQGTRLMQDILDRGGVGVSVSHSFPLDQAPQAFSALLERKVMGKALLVMGPSSRM